MVLHVATAAPALRDLPAQTPLQFQMPGTGHPATRICPAVSGWSLTLMPTLGLRAVAGDCSAVAIYV